MLHVSSSENSRVVKYSISPIGTLTVYSLNPKIDPSSEKLVDNKSKKLSAAIIPTDFKMSYQNLMMSIPVESDTPEAVINVSYISYPKTMNKPNKFEVDTKRLLKI